MIKPLLIPGVQMPRRDEEGREYRVVFDKESIERIYNSFNKNDIAEGIDIFLNDKSDSRFTNKYPEGSLIGVSKMTTNDNGDINFSIELPLKFNLKKTKRKRSRTKTIVVKAGDNSNPFTEIP